MNLGYLVLKFGLSAAVLVMVSEIAKRSTVWAALLASLPLTSLLAFVWLYIDTRDTQKVAALSSDIFWLVIPSLLLFVALAFLLRHGVDFWLGLTISAGLTVAAYLALLPVLRKFGVQL